MACYLFEFLGKLFLILVDRYSKLVCVEPVVDHTADKTILAFLNIFPKLGIPIKCNAIEAQTFYPQVVMNFVPILTLFLNFPALFTICQTLHKELSEQLKYHKEVQTKSYETVPGGLV